MDVIVVTVPASPSVIVVQTVGPTGPVGATLPVDTDETMAADSNSLIPSQRAAKRYTDNSITTAGAGYATAAQGAKADTALQSITETGNGININLSVPTVPVLSLDATLEAVANFATGAGLAMYWTGTDTLGSYTTTAFTRGFMGAVDAAAGRTALVLGSVAVLTAGTAAGNVPVLDGSGQLPTSVLPALAITETYVVASQAAMLALAAQRGDVAVRSDLNKSFILSTDSPGTLADWKELLTPTDAVLSVAGLTGAISAANLLTAIGLATSNSPQFAGINLGDAADTTITRAMAGSIAVEGTPLITPAVGGVLLTDPIAVSSVLPTLDYDLCNINGAPFAGNLTRATVGGYRQRASGLLVPTVVNEPVIDFSAGTALGTGFYGAYTNLALWSEDFTNAAWTKNNATVSANSAVAPDGATTMDKVIFDNGTQGYISQDYAFTAGSSVTCQGFVRAAELTSFNHLFLSGAFSNAAHRIITFDLVAKTATPNGSSVTAGLIEIGNGLFFWWATATAELTFSGQIQFYRAVANGNGTNGIYGWGISITATAFPVPYLPTTSAAVARAADSMVITGTDFTDFFNPVEGTLYLDATVPLVTSGYPPFMQISDNSYNNRIVIYYDGALQQVYAGAFVANVAQAGLSFVMSGGAAFKAAFSVKANSFLFSVNGAAAVTDLSGSIPSGQTRLDVGCDHAGATANSHLRRLIYWPKALTTTELQRMTA